MWGKGYNPHPKRQTYRTTHHSSAEPVNNKANIHKKRKSSSNKSANVDDDPATGAVGCDCSSLFIAFIIGIAGGGVSGFLLVTIVLLFADWFLYRSNKKTYDKKQQKRMELK